MVWNVLTVWVMFQTDFNINVFLVWNVSTLEVNIKKIRILILKNINFLILKKVISKDFLILKKVIDKNFLILKNEN